MVRLRVLYPRFPVGARVRWIGPNGRCEWGSGRIKNFRHGSVYVEYDKFVGYTATDSLSFWEWHLLEGLPLATVCRLEASECTALRGLR